MITCVAYIVHKTDIITLIKLAMEQRYIHEPTYTINILLIHRLKVTSNGSNMAEMVTKKKKN